MKSMQSEIERRLDECLVLLEEEYGFRDWFWFPRMTPTELVQWWEEHDDVPSEPLPGDVIEVTQKTRKLYIALYKTGKCFQAHIHMNWDSYLKTPAGKMIYHEGCTDTNQ